MKKQKINFIINVLLFLGMSAVTGIGLLIKYILINGQERWIVYNNNVELYFLGMDRHEWGAIHLVIGYILLGLLILHIALHWKIIVCVYDKIAQEIMISKIISMTFLIICVLFLIVPFLIKPTISKIEKGAERHTINYDKPIELKDSITQKEEKLHDTKHTDIHEQSKLRIEIKGDMSLDEISKKHNVPPDFIRTRLNIPSSFHNDRKISWLRKKQGVKMSDIEKIIKEYQEKISR